MNARGPFSRLSQHQIRHVIRGHSLETSFFGCSHSLQSCHHRTARTCPARRSLRTRAGNKSALKELQELASSKGKKKNVVAGKEDRGLKPYPISPRLHVPSHIVKPPYVDTGEMPWGSDPEIHTPEEVVKMRAACKLAAQVLQYAGTLIKPGVTTDYLDKKVHQMILENNAYPSPLTYGRFPKSVCTSINECVCHGIPDNRKLQEGDSLNIDVTVYLDGYHGDTSTMYFVGTPKPRAQWLSDITREAMLEGIKQCGPGVPINVIGKAIHTIAERHRLGICADFIGHGVGKAFHAQPQVHPRRNGERFTMKPGMTFTVEPIFVDGNPAWKMWRDGWTVVTKDGSHTAQHEHTVLITDNGHEILTTC